MPPWEKYQQAPAAGPWTKYGGAAPSAPQGELVQEPGTGKYFRVGPKGEWTPAEGPAPKTSLAGLYGQGATDAITGVLGMPVDALNWGLDKIGLGSEKPIGGSASLRDVTDYVASLPGRVSDAASQGSFAPMTDSRSTRLTPKTGLEKAAYGSGVGAGGVTTFMVPGAYLSEAGQFGPVTRAVGADLTRSPILQGIGGVAGGITGEVTGNPLLGALVGGGFGGGGTLAERGLARALGRTGKPIPGEIPPVGPTGTSMDEGGLYPSRFSPRGTPEPKITTPPPRTDADNLAADMLARALTRGKMTPDQAAADMLGMGPESMLADVGGRNLTGKVRMIANAPGEGAQTIETALMSRKAGEGTRVEKLATALTGDKRSAATYDDLAAKRATEAQPLYAKAFERGNASGDPVTNEMMDTIRRSQGETPVRYGMTSERTQQFLADPIVKQGIRKGLEIQRLEALAAGKKFNPADYGVTGFTEAGEPILSKVPNMRLLDAGKRGLDDILEGYRDKVTGKLRLDERGRAIDQVRRAYVGELDSLNPDYAAARQAWAGPSQSMDAMAWGRQALTRNTDPYLTAKQYAAMSEADKQFARLGAADWMRGIAGDAKQGSQAQRIFGQTNPELNNQAARLKIIFGDDFPKIEQMARSEAAYNRTAKVLSTSATKPLADESADLIGQMRSARSAMSGSPTGIVEMLAKAMGGTRARLGVGPEDVQASAARMATATSPEDKARVIRALQEAMMKRQSGGSARPAVFALPQATGQVHGP